MGNRLSVCWYLCLCLCNYFNDRYFINSSLSGCFVNMNHKKRATSPQGWWLFSYGLRGAILAGGTPLKKLSADLKGFDALRRNGL